MENGAEFQILHTGDLFLATPYRCFTNACCIFDVDLPLSCLFAPWSWILLLWCDTVADTINRKEEMASKFSTMQLIVALVSFLSRVVVAANYANCYYPAGGISPDVPCNQSHVDTGGQSACCNENALCLDNGLCFGAGIMSRGSCTDSFWKSKDCPQYCTGPDDNPTGGIPLTPCDIFLPTFTCGNNNSYCETNYGVFNFSGGDGFVLRAEQVAPLQQGGSPVAMLVQPSTTLRPVEGALVNGAPANTTGSANGVAAASAASTNPDGQYTVGDIAAAAAGAGGPLLLALIGALIAIFNLRRKLRKAKKQQELLETEAKAAERSRERERERERGRPAMQQHPSYGYHSPHHLPAPGYVSPPQNLPYNVHAGGYFPSPDQPKVSQDRYYQQGARTYGEMGGNGITEMGTERTLIEMDGGNQGADVPKLNEQEK